MDEETPETYEKSLSAAEKASRTDKIRSRLPLGKKKTAKQALAEKLEADEQREAPNAPVSPVITETPRTPVTPPAPLPTSHTVSPPAPWLTGPTTVFLDGGISKAENWQAQVVDALKVEGFQILNPRRWEDGRLRLKQDIQEQIKWEQKACAEAQFFLFWFPAGWVYPVAFYRLGQAVARKARIFVGCHPDSMILADLEAQREHYGEKVYQNLNVMCQDLITAMRSAAKKD